MKKYLVGGAVRDMLMGIEPKDKDYVVVGSTQEEMLSLGFQQVGADFPVFLHPETNEEYALARCEKKTGPGYLGFECRFDPSVTIEEDLVRRDLTINAIAFDEDTGEYIDPYGGGSDIENTILKHTSDAFSEDPVRVLRIARFFARYGEFIIHTQTEDLCKKIVESEDFKNINRERIWKEIYKAMSEGSGYEFFFVLKEFGVLEIEPYKTLFGKIDILRLSTFGTNINANMRLAICMDRTTQEIFPTCVELELHKMLAFKARAESTFNPWYHRDDEELVEFVLKNGMHHNNDAGVWMVQMLNIMNAHKMIAVPMRFFEVLRVVENTKIQNVPCELKGKGIKDWVAQQYINALT